MCMSVWIGNIYMYTTCRPDTHRSQKNVLDPFGTQLQMVVSLHVGVGNRTCALSMRYAITTELSTLVLRQNLSVNLELTQTG